MTDLAYLKNLRVHQGDTNWYLSSASGYIVQGPFQEEQQALEAREQIRSTARAELVDELDEEQAAKLWAEANLPWTGEFEDRVNAGEVDVS